MDRINKIYRIGGKAGGATKLRGQGRSQVKLGNEGEEGRIKTADIIERIEKQAEGFAKFVEKVGKK